MSAVAHRQRFGLHHLGGDGRFQRFLNGDIQPGDEEDATAVLVCTETDTASSVNGSHRRTATGYGVSVKNELEACHP